MVVNSPVDALRVTGTVIRLTRFLDRCMTRATGEQPSLTELTVLGSVDRGNDLASTVSRSLQIDPPRVTRMVERMVNQGYLQRGEDPVDRRRCPLSLTPSGRRVLKTARSALTESMESILARIPEPERNYFISALEAVRDILDQAR